MSLTLLGALLLATNTVNPVENPRYLSPHGEMCLVVRSYPGLGDFERLSSEEYEQKQESLAQPEAYEAALYRLWPGDYRELLAEFTLERGEETRDVLVTDDGHVVMYEALRCGAAAKLLTIRAASGSVVRRLRVRDVLTPNDHEWLCRGAESDVRFSLDGETLRMTMLISDDKHRTIDISVDTGTVAAPDGDHCPAALLVVPEADDRLPGTRNAPDVVSISSAALLGRAMVRVIPEYPDVAAMARISGRVGVQVVVGRDGKVESASIVKPLPFGLNEAVRSAIMKWEFAPGASRVSGVLAFRFEIVRDFPLRP